MFVKASLAPSHPWNCWICTGTMEESFKTPHFIVSALPIYGAFLILFHTRSFSPLSWVISQSVPTLLDEGQKHDCYEKPRLLRAFFSNWPFLLHLKGSFRFQFEAL